MTAAVELWSAQATDPDGTVRIALCAESGDRVGLTFAAENGDRLRISGLSLDRSTVQELRHVITAWLVDAPTGGRT